MSTSSIVHDDISDNHATSSEASDPSTEFEEMRFFPQWIGCQRTSTATISSTSSFQCHSPITYPVTEWGVEAFEQEVSVCFLPRPDLAYELDTPLRTQASSATLQPSGTVTPTPNSIARKISDRTRRSSFLNFNLGNLFRLPANTTSNNSNINPNLNYSDNLPRSGLESFTHLPPPFPPLPPLSSSGPSQDQSYNHNQHAYNNDLVSLPSVSSASVSTFASASAFTVASNPSISTYASVSASIAPSSASASKSQGRKSRGARSHISSSSWSYSYPYSDYMSSSSGLSIQDNYLEDIAAGIDDDRTELEEPTSPTTTTASTTTSASVLSSSSKHSNLVRRFRLRGGADEHLLKPRSATATGISSSAILGITSSSRNPSPVSPSKLPFKSRFLLNDLTKTSSEFATDDEDISTHHRLNPNTRLKRRPIFIELDEEGRMVDNRRGGKVSGHNFNDDTLKPKGHLAHANHPTINHNNNETIGKSVSNSTPSPLAVAAEHFSSTLSNNPFFHLRFRKQKRLLVKDIPTDDGEYTRSRVVALRQWAESLGAVKRLLRSVPDGTIWIEFKDREVAENVCHLHAHVHIPNVGRVRLDWVEGREAG